MIIRVVKASNGAIVGLVALITQLPIYSATAAAAIAGLVYHSTYPSLERSFDMRLSIDKRYQML